MATDKQITANRANAAKSTGPRTTEGKAVSSSKCRQSHSSRSRQHPQKRMFRPLRRVRRELPMPSTIPKLHPARARRHHGHRSLASPAGITQHISSPAAIDHEYSINADAAGYSVPTRASLAYRRFAGRAVEK